MSAMLPPRPSTFGVSQGYPYRPEAHHSATTGLGLEQPKVLITGDIRLRVTESEAALHPITGHYSIETGEMQEPLYLLWHAEGQVQSRQAWSTDIVFDMHGARAGETWTYLVSVQVTESGVRGKVVQSGVFVQIAMTSDDLAAY
jgi:hypothetical protein